MIKKYSQLNPYKLPSRSEYKVENPEEFRVRLRKVINARKELIQKKLLPAGGKIPATGDPFDFYIVSRDLQNKKNWRITYFKKEKEGNVPVGHSICDSLIRTENSSNSVEEYLQDVDWVKWSSQNDS